MKKLLVLFTVLWVSQITPAQNPFVAYGYEVKTATMSNGEYDENHDMTDVVEIGSFRFDTRKNEIVGIIERDTTKQYLAPEVVSRFVSMDPHAERYYSISPYAYCANNPVRFIDPNGKDLWDFLIGVVHSVGSNLSFGVARTETSGVVNNTNDYNTGRNVGDVVSAVMGAVEIVEGGASIIAGGGATVATAGSSSPVSVPAIATGIGAVAHGSGTMGSAIRSLSTQDGRVSQANGDTRTSNDNLRRNANGTPTTDPEAKGTKHTQLGTKQGSKGEYKQAREFDEKGKPVRDVDFTDHGRPKEHTNPHQHKYEENETGGTLKRGNSMP